MKQLYFLIPVLFFITISADAKTSNGSGTSTPITDLFPHFSNQGSAAKWVASRLIAKVHATNDGISFIPVDSVTYLYLSNDRGGATKKEAPNNDESILFDSSVTYAYNGLGYDYKQRRSQSFTIKNMVNILTYTNWNTIQGDWRDSARYVYRYDNSNIMTESRFELWYGLNWQSHITSKLDHDINNNVTEMNSTSYKAKFTYDANNNLLSIVDNTYQSGTWVYDKRKTYTYTGNDVATYTIEQWDITNSRWVLTSLQEYSYNANGDVNVIVTSNWDGSNWVKVCRNTYTYDANRNKLTDEREDWNVIPQSYSNAKREVWEYTFDNQPKTITTYSWDATGKKWFFSNKDEQLRFYYEAYFPTSIASMEVPKGTIQLYPSPAVSDVNINISFPDPQPFTVSVSDMSGRIVMQYDERASSEYHGNIPVSMLASGNYIVRVNGQDLQLCEKFIVSH